MFIVHSWDEGDKELTEKRRTPSRKMWAEMSLRGEGTKLQGANDS